MIHVAFLSICLFWTFSWFAMKMQVALSDLSVYTLIGHRCFASGLIVLIGLIILKKSIKVSKKAIPFILGMGFCHACMNFIVIYNAVKFIPSGLVSSMFSLSISLCEIIAAIWEKRKTNRIIIITGISGSVGILMMLWPKIADSSFDLHGYSIGVSLTLLAVIFFALGVVISGELNKKFPKINRFATFSYSFIFGGSLAMLISIATGNSIGISTSKGYLISMAYLVPFATIVVFLSIYYLTSKIDPAKVNYTSLVYTPSSMMVSTFFEGWKWYPVSIFGIAVVVASLFIGIRTKIRRNH